MSLIPDFDAVRDKRMSELTPAQREDARELWLRDQQLWFTSGSEHSNENHIAFLLRRLDAARGRPTVPAADTPVTATGLCATRCGGCLTDASCTMRRRQLGLQGAV